MRKIVCMILTFLLLIPVLLSGCAKSVETPAEYFKDKTIYWDIFTPAGVSADQFARPVAPALAEELGASTVQIVIKDAAGGIEAWNHTWNAEPDGLTFTVGEISDMALLNILEDPAAQFDLGQFEVLWASGPFPILFNINAKQYNSLEDLKSEKGMIFGAFTPGGNWAVMTVAIMEAFGLDAKLVTGIGTNDRVKAIGQGDMDASLLTPIRTKQELDGGLGLVKPVLVVSPNRHKDFPDVPTFAELADMNNPDVADLVTISQDIMISGYAILMPPGVPQDRLDFFAQAFDRAVMKQQQVVEETMLWDLSERKGAEQAASEIHDILTQDKQDKFRKLFVDMFDKYLVK